MRRARSRGEDDSSLDITPMIDIVFIMLIFFIVTASFIKEAGIDVNRPGAVTAERKERASILVAIDENGQVWVDKRPVDIRAVRANIERLRAENPEGGVVIQADTESKNGILVKVMDAARLAGVMDVSLAATPEGE
ncbi:MAG: biopolymer transporter ExbD [Deltaproteobacteria bacterium]|nr:biopolymer transporter ExbD [Deltaproteobacteria bacterium]